MNQAQNLLQTWVNSENQMIIGANRVIDTAGSPLSGLLFYRI